MIKAVCFDMFDTLADAHRSMEQAECDAVEVTREQWGRAMWEESLTFDRGIGNIKTVREMIDRACENLPVKTTAAQRDAAEKARCERLRMAMTDMDPQIVESIRQLKKSGLKIGLISNADVCDRKYWEESPVFQRRRTGRHAGGYSGRARICAGACRFEMGFAARKNGA